MGVNPSYKTAYGVWEVTSEVEGTFERPLGVYEGFIDEIAFAVADQSTSTLRFKRLDVKKLPVPKEVRRQVTINFDADSNTWYLNSENLLNFFKDLLKDRNVGVIHSSQYASVTLMNREVDEMKRRAALSKLTAEEKKLLGLESFENE